MTGYLLRRIGQAIIVLIGVSIIIFGLTHFLPGGPAHAILGQRASPQAIAAFNKANGYDKPVVIQYFDFLWRMLHGNFGYSYQNNQTVTSLLSDTVLKSVYLSGAALVIAVVIAIPLGIAQAVRRNGILDYTVTTGSFIGYSMPSFWLGILLIGWFALGLPVFPAEGPQTNSVIEAIKDPSAMALPVATLVIISVASFSRFMRSSAIENLAQDYIRTARAKGLSERAVLFRHLLRNSMLPIITLIGLAMPVLVAGNIIIEQVFNYPGVGLLFYTAAVRRDYPTELTVTLLIALLVVIGNLVADICYAIADPRVRYS